MHCAAIFPAYRMFLLLINNKGYLNQQLQDRDEGRKAISKKIFH